MGLSMHMLALLLAAPQSVPVAPAAVPSLPRGYGSETPSPSHLALARRLAESGTLAAIVAMAGRIEPDRIAAEPAQLTAAERADLKREAERQVALARERLMAAEARAYARLLSEADLAVLVAAAESPAARRQREVLPAVVAGTMASVGELDLKRDTLAAYCARTGKACPPTER